MKTLGWSIALASGLLCPCGEEDAAGGAQSPARGGIDSRVSTLGWRAIRAKVDLSQCGWPAKVGYGA